LLGQLGAGPDGLSFEALQEDTGQACEVRDLATARAHPEAWQKLTHRLRLVALLRHPAHRQLLELDMEHDAPFVVLGENSGSLLADIHDEELPWAPGQVLTLARELAGALQAGHRLGLAHGELWPSRISWHSGHAAKLDFTGADCRMKPSCAIDTACVSPEV